MEEDLAAEDTTIDGLETSVESFLAVAQEFAQNQAAKRCLTFAYSGMKEVHAGDLKRMRLCSALQFCVTFIERGGAASRQHEPVLVLHGHEPQDSILQL